MINDIIMFLKYPSYIVLKGTYLINNNLSDINHSKFKNEITTTKVKKTRFGFVQSAPVPTTVHIIIILQNYCFGFIIYNL